MPCIRPVKTIFFSNGAEVLFSTVILVFQCVFPWLPFGRSQRHHWRKNVFQSSDIPQNTQEELRSWISPPFLIPTVFFRYSHFLLFLRGKKDRVSWCAWTSITPSWLNYPSNFASLDMSHYAKILRNKVVQKVLLCIGYNSCLWKTNTFWTILIRRIFLQCDISNETEFDGEFDHEAAVDVQAHQLIFIFLPPKIVNKAKRPTMRPRLHALHN